MGTFDLSPEAVDCMTLKDVFLLCQIHIHCTSLYCLFDTVADVLMLHCSLYLLIEEHSCPVNVDVAVSLTDMLFLTKYVYVVSEYCKSNIVASIV